ncbi:MAG: hypothetical protein IT464_13225 [Planctomycetes bacterium]|nr:hypothetical protein [Planctomycetota bacterium]MCC7510316.1 hypothetical protein [Planctomycetota bacterium]
MKTSVLALLIALAFAPAVFAQTLSGKDAPGFDAKDCINAPEATTFEQCKGDVVLIKFWGIN